MIYFSNSYRFIITVLKYQIAKYSTCDLTYLLLVDVLNLNNLTDLTSKEKTMKKTFMLIMFVILCIYGTSVVGNTSSNTCIVKFDFDGLQAIAFGDSSRVSDGILNAHHHQPNIEIKQIENGKESVLTTLEAKELKGRVLKISVPNSEHTPTRYYSGDMNKDTSDFRWCLDIESDLFQHKLYLKDDTFFCKIHFLVGVFYTDHISGNKYEFVAGNVIHSLKRQIGALGAKVDLTKGHNLVISGLDKDIILPYNAGVAYQVSITSLPPKNMMSTDHFAYYYDVVKADVPKFVPVMIQKATFSAYPPPILCGVGIFSKSNIN